MKITEENHLLLVVSLFSSFPGLGFGLLEPAFAVAEGRWDGAKVLLLMEPHTLTSSEHGRGAQEGPVGWEQACCLEGFLLL